MLLFGETGELLIGLVYDELAGRFGEGSEGRRVLVQLAEEERAHGRVMRKMLDVLPEAYEGFDYERVFESQAEFLARCVELLSRLRTPEFDLPAALEQLAVMEQTLSESLYVHLKLLVEEEHRDALTKLAETSATHAEMIGGIPT
jgi:rubrerythrin